MKKVLILGKNGFLARSFGRYMEQFKSEYELTFISSRAGTWESVPFSGYDAVFNASGLAHSNAIDGSDEDYYEVNGRLPGAIAKKAKAEEVPVYITISSSIIYGDMADVGQKKCIYADTVPNEQGIYGKSKLMGEQSALQYGDENFRVAVIRPPMIYSEYAPENFERLCRFAVSFPIFPNLYNEQSMIYADNLCELIRLIIDQRVGGIFYPQEKEYIHTSKLVKDIADAAGHRMLVTKIFNPALRMLSKQVRFVRKAFGNVVYDQSLSNHFQWSYCVVPYGETVKRIATKYNDIGGENKCKM